MRWFLLTDRTLRKVQLYGPFESADIADKVGEILLRQGRIKGWTTLIAQVPPKISDGQLIRP